MLEISKLPHPNDLQSMILRERIERGHCCRSQEFLALMNGEEAGLLSYEDWRDKAFGFIYEIFVLLPFRQQGVGASLLSQAEHYACQLDCKSIRLKPYALDQETDQSRLRAWYTKMGYRQTKDNPEHIEKHLRKQGTA